MTNAIAQIVASNETAQAITEANKAAAKPRQRRAPQAAKAAAKDKAAPASAVVTAAKTIGVKYSLTAARPAAGRALYAFTEAVLQLLKMYDGAAVDRKTLTAIVGDRAVAYHLTKTFAFTLTDKGIALNGDFGADWFKQRVNDKAFDPQDFEDFKVILTTGKADNRLVKNANFIKAI
jgi:hypothetical protein